MSRYLTFVPPDYAPGNLSNIFQHRVFDSQHSPARQLTVVKL
ncbi:hypothetical protein BC2230_40464 [Burkholderia cepacia]